MVVIKASLNVVAQLSILSGTGGRLLADELGRPWTR